MARRRPEISLIPRPNPRADEALYLQVARAIEEAIRSGHVRVGQRLPAERRLATDLGVSRTTVTGAYQELEARGLLRGHVGRGTLVVAAPAGSARAAFAWSQRASALALRATPAPVRVAQPGHDVIAFENGYPDPTLYPAELLDGLLDRLPGRGQPELFQPAPAAGDPALREAVAGWLATRNIAADAGSTLITVGGQQAINVLARAFLAPGDVVLTESLTFQCALVAFRWSGADVIGVPMDHEGMQPDALEDALARYRPKFLYTIPTFHNPTGAVLNRERRRRLLELAARYRVPVVESDLYGELHFDAPSPPRLKAEDGDGLVIYLGSFSKIAVPGLRIGWLVASPEVLGPLTLAKEFVDLHTPRLTQRLAAAFLGGRHVERHLGTLRVELRARRDTLVAALHEHCPRLAFRIPAGGNYLWARLPAPLTTTELLPRAAEHGVTLRPEPQFTPDGRGREHVRFCYAALPPRAITEGARRLGAAMAAAWRDLERPGRPAATSAASVV